MEFNHNQAIRQFELFLEGKKVGYLTYVLQGEKIDLNFVYVNSDYRGQGLAARLVEQAIDYVKSNNLKPIFTCPAIQAVIRKNYPEFVH